MSISEAGLDRSDISIGNGRFGSCSLATLNDSFRVCVKSIVSFSIDNVKAEAAIMISLNLGGFTPYCFGVNLARKAIVMSHISIDGKATTLYSALKTHESLVPACCISCITDIAHGIKYIHEKDYLHNDLKLDNNYSFRTNLII